MSLQYVFDAHRATGTYRVCGFRRVPEWVARMITRAARLCGRGHVDYAPHAAGVCRAPECGACW